MAGASRETLIKRAWYGGRKARSARRRLGWGTSSPLLYIPLFSDVCFTPPKYVSTNMAMFPWVIGPVPPLSFAGGFPRY